MKRSILASFCILTFFVVAAAHGQVVESATGRSFSVDAGGLGSMFQPDYAGEGVAQTSPNHLFGVGAYVDAHFTRWVQIEAEGRWSHFNEFLGISENSHLIGPRVPVTTWHNLTSYGKFLVGLGNGSFLTGNTFVMSYGGGVDYRLNRKFTIRAFDFEFQQWQVTPTLHPYGGSVGLAYRVF